MNLTGLLENGLFALGQVLRLPVMLLLWLCVAAALYYAARCLTELVARNRERRGFDLQRWLKAGAALRADATRLALLPADLRRLLSRVQQQYTEQALGDGGLENIVAAGEETLRHRLNGPRALVRIGPSLGLMGTLIPMGGSLAAMASGNLQAMSSQMVVAFTSTIIGLAAGTLAYGVTTLRQGWLGSDVREQRFLAEHLVGELERR
ncbi:MAG: MotA/TolQ/ExbB proton channel family protein [Steroidobacteraceae bacterium]